MPEPRFQRGDLVRHRASGEVAVVVYANFDHGTFPAKFTGSYDLDLGFARNVIQAEEYLLEPVEDEDSCE